MNNDPLMAAWGMVPPKAGPSATPSGKMASGAIAGQNAVQPTQAPKSSLYGKTADQIATLFWFERPGRPAEMYLTAKQTQALARAYLAEGRSFSSVGEMNGAIIPDGQPYTGVWTADVKGNGAAKFTISITGQVQAPKPPTPAGGWSQPASASDFDGWKRLGGARGTLPPAPITPPTPAPAAPSVADQYRAAIQAGNGGVAVIDRADAQAILDGQATAPSVTGTIMPDLLKLKAESDARDAAADAMVDAFLAGAPAAPDLADYGSAITAPVAAALADTWDAQVALGEVAMILADCGLDAETKVQRMRKALGIPR